MREPYELVHQNRYRVSCRPDPTPEGTFLARVLVSWIDDDGSALDHRLRPSLPPFPTATEAAAVARDAALRWLEALEAGWAGGANGAAVRSDASMAAALEALDRDDYFAAQREWRTAAEAFEAAMQRALENAEPLDATRTATDAAALKRLHERWLEMALHLSVVKRR